MEKWASLIVKMGSHANPIPVFNRYTGAIETEPVYGEKWLRWTYESVAGRLALGVVVRRHWFSRFYGWRMSRPGSRSRVIPFIARYRVDEAELAQPTGTFETFNDFFSRKLRPAARPVCDLPGSVIFPADGRHLGFPEASAASSFYAKGQSLNLAELLQSDELARKYEQGALVISRLCPVDYHRFHFPCSGICGDPELVNGMLYSVSPIALRRNLGYLTQNKRVITHLESPECGRVVLIEIGATCVGTIVQTSNAGAVRKGEEKGYFRFGGSCVISIFEPGKLRLAQDLIDHSREGREIYAKMGDHLGTVCSA